MRKSIKTFLFALVLISPNIHAQTPTDPTARQVVPPSPKAWEFTKYGEYPVSRETGVPNISIPIYTINAGQLTVPITLSYHAGGNKVDTKASWVGLGWNIQTGGLISRTLRGIPDESPNGLVHLDEQLNGRFFDEDGVIQSGAPYVNTSSADDHLVLVNMTNVEMDSEPDIFHYNFGSYSGRFFLDPNGFPVTQPHSDLKITFSPQEIVVIAPDGIRYTFSKTVVTTIDLGPHLITYTSAWWLSKIESFTRKDVIQFFYVPYASTDPEMVEVASITDSYSQGITSSFPPPYVESRPRSDIEMTLQRIEFDGGKIKFEAVAGARLDDDNFKLTSIDIYDKENATPIKSFVFNYDYFNSCCVANSQHTKRLKLVSLQEKGRDGSINPPYEFTYLETGENQLPPRHSTSQDYWGYSNGVSNMSLLPRLTIRLSDNQLHTLGHANREPNAAYMQAGILHTIVYPTSGKTQFDFESNDYFRTYQRPIIIPVNPTAIAMFSGSDEDEFTAVQSETTSFSYAIQYFGSGTPPISFPDAYVSLFDVTSNKLEFGYAGSASGYTFDANNQNGTRSQPITLIAGHTYKLFARVSDNSQDMATISLTYSTTTGYETINENPVVGGLRIKTIKNFDADGTLTTSRNYNYRLPSDASRSSGQYNLYSTPTPQSFVSMSTTKYTHITPGNDCTIAYDYTYSISAQQVQGIGYPSGDPVTYRFVTETNGLNNGKSIYEYETHNDENVGALTNFTLDKSWLRGQLKRESHYSESDAATPVQDIVYNYQIVDLPFSPRGMKVSKIFHAPSGVGGYCITCIGVAGAYYCDETALAESRASQFSLLMTYYENIQWKRLVSITETTDGISKTTSYEYNPELKHTNVTSTQSTSSKGETLRQEIRYAYETNNSFLQEKNVTGVPLESDSRVNGQLTDGSRVTYNFINGLYLPLKFESRLTNSSSYRLLKEIKDVDVKGNTTKFITSAGITTSYIWGYDNTLPIAEAVNAQGSQIAYTSFENATSSGGWTYQATCPDVDQCLAGCPDPQTEPAGYEQCSSACQSATNQCQSDQQAALLGSKTGNRSFAGSSITKTNLPSDNYVLSFWARKKGSSDGSVLVSGITGAQVISGSEWQYFQFNLNAITQVSLTLSDVVLDELRIHPASAQMTTYTYDPLVGMTSGTDPNNTTTYYEYDEFGRVEVVRDSNHNIVKHYKYHYKNEP